MRRADRLFQIIEILRRRRMATAAQIAEELEVSPRTIYRDMSDLSASGVPIAGEAGFGYALQPGFDLPPIMLRQEEAEALALGARMLSAWSDPDLARIAEGALAKILSKLPEPQARAARREIYIVREEVRRERPAVSLIQLRRAIEKRLKVRFSYRRLDDAASERIIWPLALAFFGPAWLLLGWCETREDFRNFRLDRMWSLEVSLDSYPEQRGRRLRDYLQIVAGHA